MFVSVTLNPNRFLVFPGRDRADVVKCCVLAKLGFMQGMPLKKEDVEAFGSATQ